MAIRSSSSLLSNLRKYQSKTPSFISFSRAPFSPSSGSISSITNHIEEEESSENDDNLKTRLFKLRFPKRSATTAIQNWINEGNQVTLTELRQLAKDLNKSHRFKHALEIVTRKKFELSDTDYATQINLMTKVFGVDSAERYFEGRPQASKTGETYTALLHSYASVKLTDRAESFFERIQRENFSISALAYLLRSLASQQPMLDWYFLRLV
ncbi:hypothetical protein MKX03_013002 [Papaver bracteatum]|nr:hypothetical protein MKX03_013002 [Papaver bracteatum]